jgi:hypothetical protein
MDEYPELMRFHIKQVAKDCTYYKLSHCSLIMMMKLSHCMYQHSTRTSMQEHPTLHARLCTHARLLM